MSKTHPAPILIAAILALAAPVVASARPDEGRGGGQSHQGGGWRGGGGGRYEQPRGGAPYGRGEPAGGGRYGYRPPAPSAEYPQGAAPQGAGRYTRYPRDEGAYYGEPPQPAPRRPANSLREGWRQQQDEAREGVRNGELAPLRDILPSLRQRMPGRMLDTGIEEGADGRAVYRIRWAAMNGRRMDFIVDARTGAVLGTEGQ